MMNVFCKCVLQQQTQPRQKLRDAVGNRYCCKNKTKNKQSKKQNIQKGKKKQKGSGEKPAYAHKPFQQN